MRDPRTYGGWRWNGARQKRPMSSIVLEPGVKDMILADCQDFLCSEEWYVASSIFDSRPLTSCVRYAERGTGSTDPRGFPF